MTILDKRLTKLESAVFPHLRIEELLDYVLDLDAPGAANRMNNRTFEPKLEAFLSSLVRSFGVVLIKAR